MRSAVQPLLSTCAEGAIIGNECRVVVCGPIASEANTVETTKGVVARCMVPTDHSSSKLAFVFVCGNKEIEFTPCLTSHLFHPHSLDHILGGQHPGSFSLFLSFYRLLMVTHNYIQSEKHNIPVWQPILYGRNLPELFHT